MFKRWYVQNVILPAEIKKNPISLFLFRFQIKTPIAFLLPRTTFDRPKPLAHDKANKIHDSNKSELKLVSTFRIHK